jgi:SAM-dependent methyltransferase
MTEMNEFAGVKNCILCNSTGIVLHRWSCLENLRSKWIKGFGFDPFDQPLEVEELRQYLCLNCDLRFYDPPLAGDAAFYEELSSRFGWYYEKDKWEFDEAIRFIAGAKDVRSILEVGCGNGHFIRRLHANYKVQGLEFNPRAIDACQMLGLNVRSGLMNTISETFDLVAAFEVLEHISDPLDFLTQATRLIRPGGYLLLAVPDPESYFSESEDVLLDMPPHHVLSFSKKTLTSLCERFGMEQIQLSQEPLRFIHYKSYLLGLIEGPLPPSKLEVLVERYLGLSLGRNIRALEQRLLEAVVAASFKGAREHFNGQTHLVVYQKL